MPRRTPIPTTSPVKVDPIAPLGLTNEQVVSHVLRRVLDLKDGNLYQVGSSWSDGQKPSNLDADRMELREDHAKPLVTAGLIELEPNVGPARYRLTAAGVALARPLSDIPPFNVQAVLEDVLGTVLFGPSDAIGGRTAIPAIYSPSKTNSNLVLVLGENAAGKSLFRRVLNQITHKGQKAGYGDPEIPRGRFPVGEFLGLSMQGRTGDGFGKSFVYGVETYHSTGENSAHTIEGAFRTAAGRGHTSCIYFDEPDIGMSAGASAGAGIAIRDFIAGGSAPLVQAVFITSHSPALVRQLASLDPHYLFLGNEAGPKTLTDWFDWQQNPPPVSIKDLQESAHKRYKDVQAVLDAKPKKSK